MTNSDLVQTPVDGKRAQSAKRIFETVRGEGRSLLLEPEAYALLAFYDIPVAPFRFVEAPRTLIEAGREVGYPAVLKVVSPDIAHKSDVGGVIVGLRDESELEAAWKKMRADLELRAPRAALPGFLVARQAAGIELTMGGHHDEHFGPVLMFGLGGIFVEALDDVTFRLLPIGIDDAHQMMAELKGSRLLEGYRGTYKPDLDDLAKLLVRVGMLLTELPEIESFDLNPAIANNEGTSVVDARFFIK